MAAKTIWKYVLGADVLEQEIYMPDGAQVLCVQMQGGGACLWALVDPSNVPVTRRFRVIGTGWRIDNADDVVYVGTFQPNDGESPLVFHVFECVRGEEVAGG